MFFIRSIFWLSVVFVLLPVAPEDKNKIEPISPFEAIGAAAATVRDLSGFCARNPETCATGGKAAVAFGYKAKYGAQQLLTSSDEDAPEESEKVPVVPHVDSTPASLTTKSDPGKVQSETTPVFGTPTPRARPVT
uniref:DUF5330 domain-containing protein n=1 Tax=Pararhizobium sp. IMCC3301 TaxID=3067904 RepID=UPI00274165A4|nr:DUF5330 domain-containing protein [Pararhizobium sp. IMCC3301]